MIKQHLKTVWTIKCKINSRFYCLEAVRKQDEQKLVKVSIIGVPNAGKSTLINSLMDQRICPTSSKVHTTRNFSRAITTRNDSQVILFDTPGLVGKKEMKKHKLDEAFVTSCHKSIKDSNLIGVLQDVSNQWTRQSLNPLLLQLLEEYKDIPSFLILNKIDKLKSKRVLLDLIKTLTCNNIGLDHINNVPQKVDPPPQRSERPKIETVGWPNFQNVFMVSSITGDGISKVMDFIESNAQQNSWEYKNNEYSDQKPEELIEQFVKARLLDYLPQEIPYLLTCQLEYFSNENDKIYASVIVTCPNARTEKLLCGVSDGKLKQITERVTSDLIESFRMPIQLTISTFCEAKKK